MAVIASRKTSFDSFFLVFFRAVIARIYFFIIEIDAVKPLGILFINVA